MNFDKIYKQPVLISRGTLTQCRTPLELLIFGIPETIFNLLFGPNSGSESTLKSGGPVSNFSFMNMVLKKESVLVQIFKNIKD